MNWLNSLAIMGLLFSLGENLPEINFDGLYANTNTAAHSQDPASLSVTEKVTGTYRITSDGKVSISNVNGDISVTAWESDSIEMEVVKSAATKELLDGIEVKVDSRADSFELEIVYPQAATGRNHSPQTNIRNLKADIKLKVPAGINLNGIELVNGTVRVNGLTNNSRVSLVNGAFIAVNMAGSGDISTVSGSIDADFRTINPTSKISLGTVSGQIALRLPSNSNAILRASTLNGAITNNLGLTNRSSGFIGKELKGKIGSGEAQVNLSSVNGKLAVTRRTDGQKVSAAEDLVSESNTVPNLGKLYTEAFASDRAISESDRGAAIAKFNDGIAAINSLQQTITAKTAAINLAQVKELAELDKQSEEIANRVMAETRLSAEAVKIDQKAVEEMSRVQAAKLNQFRSAWWGNGVPSIETRSKHFKMPSRPKITLNCDGAELIIKGWEKEEVKYSITEVSENRNRIPVKVIESLEGAKLHLDFTDANQSPRSGYLGPRSNSVIEVMVPPNAEIVIKTNRDIRVNNVKGKLELEGKDNSVNIREFEGILALKNINSRVRVLAFDGVLENNAENSEISLDGNFNSLISNGSDNKITVTLPDHRSYRVRSNAEFGSEGLDPVAADNDIWTIGSGEMAELSFNNQNSVLFLRTASSLMPVAAK